MIKVLFVCLGNICRSPMADAVMQNLVKEAGLSDKIQVDSAGTGGWHVGEPAHHGTRDILKKHEVPYDGRARQFKRNDVNEFDYILGMDTSNLADLQQIADQLGHSKIDKQPEINLFLHYANETHSTNVKEVPDPYYSGNFDYVYELVVKGCQALLDHIRKEHAL